MLSLIPFSTGDEVCEVIGARREARKRIVRITTHDKHHCWTEHGHKYDRLTGRSAESKDVYRGIHTPGYPAIEARFIKAKRRI